MVSDLIGAENMNPAAAGWGLQITLAYLDHLAVLGEVARARWTAIDDLGAYRGGAQPVAD